MPAGTVQTGRTVRTVLILGYVRTGVVFIHKVKYLIMYSLSTFLFLVRSSRRLSSIPGKLKSNQPLRGKFCAESSASDHAVALTPKARTMRDNVKHNKKLSIIRDLGFGLGKRGVDLSKCRNSRSIYIPVQRCSDCSSVLVYSVLLKMCGTGT